MPLLYSSIAFQPVRLCSLWVILFCKAVGYFYMSTFKINNKIQRVRHTWGRDEIKTWDIQKEGGVERALKKGRVCDNRFNRNVVTLALPPPPLSLVWFPFLPLFSILVNFLTTHLPLFMVSHPPPLVYGAPPTSPFISPISWARSLDSPLLYFRSYLHERYLEYSK